MGVVDLHNGVFMKLMEIDIFFLHFLHDHLGSRRYKKILLIDPEFSSIFIAVVWIKEKGQILFDILFVEADARFQDRLIDCIKIE